MMTFFPGNERGELEEVRIYKNLIPGRGEREGGEASFDCKTLKKSIILCWH